MEFPATVALVRVTVRQFLFGCWPHAFNLYREMQNHARKWVIHVYGNLVANNLLHPQ